MEINHLSRSVQKNLGKKMANERIKLSGRLDGRQRNRMKSLLNMLYRPNELAQEIGISKHQIYRVYVPSGCPNQRDPQNHIWINGQAFCKWYGNFYSKIRLGKTEAFCLTCKQGVPMLKPVLKKKEGLTYALCKCPNCGRKLAKIISQTRERVT
jgi:hypothetical protein